MWADFTPFLADLGKYRLSAVVSLLAMGCLVHLSELSWTVLDGDLTTDCLHLDHMWDLSESETLHADTGLIRARSYLRLFSGYASKLLNQAWGSVSTPWPSSWERVNWPFWCLSWRQQLCHHVIKTFVTSSALTLGMIDTWGLGHFFFGHFLPLIILLPLMVNVSCFFWVIVFGTYPPLHA